MKKKKIQFVNYKLKNSQKDISKFIIPKPKNKNIIKKCFTINKKKTDIVSEEQLLEVLYFLFKYSIALLLNGPPRLIFARNAHLA